MSWIFFALAAPFLFAVSNFIDRFLIEKRIKDPFFISMLGGFFSLFVGILIFFVRHFPVLPTKDLIILLVGGIFLELGLIPWYKAISIDDPSRIVAIFQLIPVVVLVTSYVFLGERLSLSQAAGFVLVILGGFLIAVECFSWKLFAFRKSLWPALAAVVLFALPVVMFKFAAQDQSFWNSLVYDFFGAGIGGVIILIYLLISGVEVGKLTREIKKDTWQLLGVNEGVYFMGRLSWFYAIILGPVSLVAVVSGGVQPFFVFVMGVALAIWFPQIVKEDISPKTLLLKITAIILMFAGIFIMR